MCWRSLLLGLAIAWASCSAWPVAAETVDCSSGFVQWSKTVPPVDLTHIFCGELDPETAELQGYHALAGVRSPGEARIMHHYAGPNADGISRAVICLPEDKMAEAGRPCKCASLFPDDWTVDQVVEAIVTAVKTGTVDDRGFFRGAGGAGFAVEGWLLPPATAHERCGSDLCVATAWPSLEDDVTGEPLPWTCPLPD